MTTAAKKQEFVTFSPNLRGDDPCANYWMRQVTFRLRREVCWCWHERGPQTLPGEGTLPPFSDKVSQVLDLSRFWAEKQNFYRSDPTAQYLTEQLTSTPMPSTKDQARGSFGWVIDELELDDVATFVLALALVVAFDGSMGSVIATCMNDHTRTLPSLALAQKLWDQPEQVLRIADPCHPLFRYGLATYSLHSDHSYADLAWEAPITVPSPVVQQLLFPSSFLPQGLVPVTSFKADEKVNKIARLAALRLSATTAKELRLIPVIGPKGSSRREMVEAIARLSGKDVVEFQSDASLVQDHHYASALATVCWLRDIYLFFSREMPAPSADKHPAEQYVLPSASIPVNLLVAVNEHSQLGQLPASLLQPAVHVPPCTYAERVQAWEDGLGRAAKKLAGTIAECSRRFRFEKETIDTVCKGLKKLPKDINAGDVVAACRAELDANVSELASPVVPRFHHEELILPQKQDLQFQEIVKAMQSLTEVHYGWGTGKVWNEGGISVLFGGPPGTGKTMAAEILALKLDLPMYRIDLSQVVNKYIGETEKNLKRVFDAADQSDMILFFDEADSLFGRRTEVSDAHDRYANLEISYLLERMERFKGLAILATNRKKDLDEAFLRRLRYIVDFPLPDVKERKKIWQQVIPQNADSSQLDFDFLAERFPLAGGNIRSIVFNACLQSAGAAARTLTMKEIIVAVKREYDKVNRKLSRQQYGPYAPLMEGLDLE